jgi:hypothetical protein
MKNKWLLLVIASTVLLLIVYLAGCSSTPSPTSEPNSVPASTQTPAPVSPTPAPEYILQCFSWSNYTEYGYIHVVGEVKNISNVKLENVVAVVSFRTEDGTLVKTDDALIDYDVLMPGQTSSFEVLTTENSAIKKLGLSFKQLFGSQIPTKFD